MARFDLTDFEWSVIQPLLPNKPRGVARVEDRRVLNGIFWRLRTGAPWADIPERYGPHTTCVNRFNRWRKAGVWDRLLAGLATGFWKSTGEVEERWKTAGRIAAGQRMEACRLPLALARRAVNDDGEQVKRLPRRRLGRLGDDRDTDEIRRLLTDKGIDALEIASELLIERVVASCAGVLDLVKRLGG